MRSLTLIVVVLSLIALTADLVVADTVLLKNGAQLHGTMRPGEAAGTIELQMPGGVLVLQEADIEKSEQNSLTTAPARSVPEPRPAPEARLTTTHKVVLNNERELRGNVRPSPADGPLLLELGGIGLVEIPRDQIQKVIAESGTVEFGPGSPESSATEDDDMPSEQMENERVLGELATRVIDRRLAEWRHAVPVPTAARIAELEDQVAELSRQRTTNRTRAENHLRAAGAAAIPFLEPACRSPFSLTRRAAMRIVGEAGEPSGARLAIPALGDPDHFVRKLAHTALTRLLPQVAIDDQELGSPAKRQAAQSAYWEAYALREEQLLLDALKEELSDVIYE